MKIKATQAPQAREALGDMARGISEDGYTMALMQLPAGTDFCPFLEGLPDDMCACEHWGYVLEGTIEVDYSDGSSETVEAGDLYYWKPGHTIKVEGDTRYVEFSPTEKLEATLDHVVSKLPAS